jgi:uncharacterized protein (TIGR02001 family)
VTHTHILYLAFFSGIWRAAVAKSVCEEHFVNQICRKRRLCEKGSNAMRASITRFVTTAVLLPFLAMATPAFAQEEPEGPPDPLSIDFTLAAFSDYRFRGLTATLASGFYASIFASNIAENPGDDIEIDLIAGFSKDIGKVSAGINATYYVYPGFSSINYVEFIGTLGTAVGPGEVGLTLGYSPKQDNIGDQDNVYVALNGSVPIKGTPFSLTGSVGYEDGAFGDKKKDWLLGVTADVAGFTLGASYIDTKRGGPLGDATAVFSISRDF